MYTTQLAEIGMEMPRQTRKMSAIEIVEYMRVHFKSNFAFDDQGRIAGQKPSNKATAYLMACSSALMDPEDWKNGWRAVFPECGQEWAKAVVIWYHATEPKQTYNSVISTGYDAW